MDGWVLSCRVLCCVVLLLRMRCAVLSTIRSFALHLHQKMEETGRAHSYFVLTAQGGKEGHRGGEARSEREYPLLVGGRTDRIFMPVLSHGMVPWFPLRRQGSCLFLRASEMARMRLPAVKGHGHV
jgi:hypothetical protein